MGHAARSNPRSTEGGKPAAYASFHRCIRACRTFHGDEGAFHRWLATTQATEAHVTRMQRIWDALHPKPLVCLHDSIPDSLRA